MQHPVSSPPQLVETDIPCPNLFTFDIQLTPTSDANPEIQQWTVMMSLAAGTHWFDMAEGQVQVAIAQAHLTLDLQNATFSPANEESWSVEGISLRRFPNSIPRFEISSLEGTPLDADTIQNLALGSLHMGDGPSSAAFTVTIAPRDIRIVSAEGLWRHDITPNKHGIIERKLAWAIAETTLASHLGYIQWCYRCPNPCDRHPHPPRSLDDAALKEIIDTVIHAPTSNILDLAKQAGLVIETDLAGVQFRGASLSGLDLSNVDLSDANLRGADLTDAELSEANLSDTKLGGADLSGADLGSANLRNADLHKASLALSNLSGADLTYANLRDTNLSQTNLNGVHVEGAIFSHNTGLSDDVKATLVEKGAIVDEG